MLTGGTVSTFDCFTAAEGATVVFGLPLEIFCLPVEVFCLPFFFILAI